MHTCRWQQTVARRDTSGAAIRISLEGQYYVGTGICWRDKDAIEQARRRSLA